MSDRDRAAFAQQQLRHRLADQDRTSDHHRVQPREVAQPVLQQHQAAQRSARHQPGQAEREAPGADWGQTIDILGRVDPFNHRLLIQMLRQRQLHQNAIDHRIVIKLVDHCDQIGLAGIGGQPVFKTGHAAGHRLLGFRSDIDLAGRVIAHQHHREPRLAARALFKGGGEFGDPAAQPLGKCLAVDYCRAHEIAAAAL